MNRNVKNHGEKNEPSLISAELVEDTMSTTPVTDWNRIFKKGTRTKDGIDAGIVVGVSSWNLIIQKGVTRELIVPKEHVEGFDGNEVYLDIPSNELSRYEMKI